MVTPIESTRIHYLDNLRSLAMLLGVYLHAGLAYAEPSRSVWVATNPRGSASIDASIWWIHLFRMGLFFLLSGYFSKWLVQRRGLRSFLWNRFLRIGLPFVLFWPLLTAAMTIVFIFAISYVEEPQGLLKVIVATSQDLEPGTSSPPYTTGHLWFLYYLLMFSLIAATTCRWTWLSFDWLFQRPQLLVLAPMALVPGVMGSGLPIATPDSFIPTWWPLGYYGLFYWFGWQLFGRELLLERLRPWCWHLLLVGCLLFIPHYLLLPVLDIRELQQLQELQSTSESRSAVWWIAESVLAAYTASILILSALLVGQRVLGRPNAWFKFCADSSYWVYLLHLPIVFFLQTVLIPIDLPVVVKLIAVSLGAWLTCVATYLVFVRYTPIGWMLHGRRSFP